jgi:hypothetical protein
MQKGSNGRLSWAGWKVSRWNWSFRGQLMRLMAFAALLLGGFAMSANAAPPGATIEYQPMTSDGLAAGYPFEAWVVFNMSSNPSVPGMALPAGTTFRFTFPPAFTPQANYAPQAVLLYNLPQIPAPVPFTIGLDPQDLRTIVLKLTADFPAAPPERPGLKSIHLRWGPINPMQAGDHPITIQISDAGELSGTIQAVAPITPKPVPNIAGYNQLHEGRSENWQHVKVGQTATLPIDLLVNLPDKARSFISLRPIPSGHLEILSDGKPIGTITRRGVPVTLKPLPFGPGFARLGILRYSVTAGSLPGVSEIIAQLQGGTSYTITVIVEP